METVLIVIHLMIVVALVGVVLLQKSEGGGLGIGGGSGGGMMSARKAGDTLTRSTTILGGAFFATSILLGVLGRYGEDATDVLDQVPTIQQPAGVNGEVPSDGGLLDQLGPAASEPETPAVPNN